MTDESQDAESIRTLMSRYGRMLDERDYGGWAALFAPDGEWVGGALYGAIRGREALADFATREFANTPPCVHIFSSLSIELDGDSADCWSRWMLVEQRAEGLTIALAGSYADRLVKRREGWFFGRREVNLSLPVQAL